VVIASQCDEFYQTVAQIQSTPGFRKLQLETLEFSMELDSNSILLQVQLEMTIFF
jgi:hypothetical protein